MVTSPHSCHLCYCNINFSICFIPAITFSRRTYFIRSAYIPSLITLKTFIISYEIKQFFCTQFVDLLLRDFMAGFIVYVHGQQSWILKILYDSTVFFHFHPPLFTLTFPLPSSLSTVKGKFIFFVRNGGRRPPHERRPGSRSSPKANQ